MTASPNPSRSFFFRLADEIEIFLEKHFWQCGAIFVALLLICSAIKDVRNKMWIDELYTLFMSRQGGPTEIIRATLEGCDAQPPLYAMIVHSILPLIHSEALAVRLPSSLGVCGMVLFLLGFCRRRLPAVYSVVAALLACNACLLYSTEGRCYGLVLGCSAAALFYWQAAADGRKRIVTIPLLALSLALMTALHYGSIFFLGPLLLAELIRWRTSGKLDTAILAAFASVLLVLSLHYPLIEAAKQFTLHPWALASWRSLSEMLFYAKMFAPLILLAILSILPRDRNSSQVRLTPPEWVATAVFSLMPLCVLVVSIYTTHIFIGRYTLWAVAGIAVLVASLLCLGARDKNVVGSVAAALLLALIAGREVSGLLRTPLLVEGESVLQELTSLPAGSEPIVIADHHVFMELSYYAPPQIRDRLIYPLSEELDLRYFGFDTGALLLSALSHRSNLHIVGYDAMLAANPRFVLAAVPKDYLPSHLAKMGYSLIPLDSWMPPMIYEVEAPAR